MTDQKQDVLTQWEADACRTRSYGTRATREYLFETKHSKEINKIKDQHFKEVAILEQRICALIKLVRAKDEALRKIKSQDHAFIGGEGLRRSGSIANEALALTDQLQ